MLQVQPPAAALAVAAATVLYNCARRNKVSKGHHNIRYACCCHGRTLGRLEGSGQAVIQQLLHGSKQRQVFSLQLVCMAGCHSYHSYDRQLTAIHLPLIQYTARQQLQSKPAAAAAASAALSLVVREHGPPALDGDLAGG